MEELIEFQIENCTDAIGVAGTTGETACLDMQEHIADLALGSQGIISVLSISAQRKSACFAPLFYR